MGSNTERAIDKPIKLVISGHAGAGKSALCDYLATERGFEVCKPSKEIEKYAAANGIVLNSRSDYVDTRILMTKADRFAHIRCAIDCDTDVVADGVRTVEAITELRRIGAVLIALECPDALRFERAKADMERTGSRQKLTFEDFKDDEAKEYENIDQIMKLADFSIDASGTFEQVCEQVDAIIGSMDK